MKEYLSHSGNNHIENPYGWAGTNGNPIKGPGKKGHVSTFQGHEAS